MNHVIPRFSGAALALALLWVGPAAAQTATSDPNQHYDLNVYPVLAGQSGLYDLKAATTQSGPAGTIAMTSASPPAAYSFQDILANTHGYVEAGVSSRSGHSFSAGVTMPIVPGKADLDLAVGTEQFSPYRAVAGGKAPIVTSDSYSAGLHLHPSDDLDAYIGFTGLRIHGSGFSPYAYP